MATKYTADQVRDISEKVYRMRLERDSGKGSPERMTAEHKDQGQKLRNFAGQYDSLVRDILAVLDV